jgi:hypothetical protein
MEVSSIPSHCYLSFIPPPSLGNGTSGTSQCMTCGLAFRWQWLATGSTPILQFSLRPRHTRNALLDWITGFELPTEVRCVLRETLKHTGGSYRVLG